MLSRTVNRVEAALSASTKRSATGTVNSRLPPVRSSTQAASLAETLSSSPKYYIPPHHNSTDKITPLANDMQGFLKRRPVYTLLPTPLPDDRTSALHEFYWSSNEASDAVSVIDACLHRFLDVPRAKIIFDRLRVAKSGDPNLDTRLYNHIMEAYFGMASTTEGDPRVSWLEEMWKLFSAMETGPDVSSPNSTTYAIAFLALTRFPPDSEPLVSASQGYTFKHVLSSFLDRGLNISDLLISRVLSRSSETSAVIQMLSKSAVELGETHIVQDLGMATSIASGAIDSLESVPEVMPVTTIKTAPPDTDPSQAAEPSTPFNLSNLRKHLSLVRLARRALPEDLVARQKLLEESVWDIAQARMKQENETFHALGMDTHAALKSNVLQAWMWDWHLRLTERLENDVRVVERMEHDKRREKNNRRDASIAHVELSPFLSLLKPEKLSLVTILEVMRLHGTGGVTGGMKTARTLLQVGKAVESEYKSEMCRKNNIEVIPMSFAEQDLFTRFGYNDLHARRVTARKYMEDSEEWTSVWTQTLRAKVGSVLVDALMSTATVERTATNKKTGEKVTEIQPAFFHGYEYLRGQRLGVIRTNPVVADRLSKDSLRESVHPRHLPMLVPPKPWLDYNRGGYIFNDSYAMRFKESYEQLTYLKHASNLGHIELLYAGLDVLSSTPWKINREIFDVVLKVWNSGERLGKIPPAVYDVPEPEKLSEGKDREAKAKSVWLQRQKAWNHAKANNHSDRCNVNYKLEIARAFLGDTLYQPHNIDFRGRAYPIPPHLNHIGNDLSRGLLKFAEKRVLGERGLRWLHIHLANVYGFDKASFDDRVGFVVQNMAEVYDSAERPLDGRRWWTLADDPWQCLATCMELRSALEHSEPTAYESDLPVHQDGTCNGLQHYAALGGDDQGARQVNLDVTDRPSDVYTYVSNMVEQLIEKDIEAGDKMGITMQGKVSRKVVKQTVMTTVYGVTYVGAREQIEKQLRDKNEFNEEECWAASAYVAKKVLASITNLFSGAKAIQLWLNLCARLIAKSIPESRIPDPRSKKKIKFLGKRLRKEQMTSVVWTTPLGLPVVQPYRKAKKKQIATSLQSVYISDPKAQAEVNSMKQAAAFPPNFIHSLDATHMMLTALECRTQGLTFASVHDSYWTHASSIDQMSVIIRDTFIALHSSDVLGKLHAEFKERYKGFKVPVKAIKSGRLPKDLKNAGVKLRIVGDDALEAAEASTTTDENVPEEDEEGESESEVEDESAEPPLDPEPGVRVVQAFMTRKPKPKKGDNATYRDGFVDLVDLFPPLPEKGGFNVKTIKKSLYFFS